MKSDPDEKHELEGLFYAAENKTSCLSGKHN